MGNVTVDLSTVHTLANGGLMGEILFTFIIPLCYFLFKELATPPLWCSVAHRLRTAVLKVAMLAILETAIGKRTEA